MQHLHKEGVRFHPMRTKCLLTKQDVEARFKFAKKYRTKPAEWWLNQVCLHIDIKSFPVHPNAKARDYAARREVRGAYRKKGGGLGAAYVKQPKDLRYCTGAKPCRIAAGIGKGRVALWEEIKGRWTGAKAAELYSGPLKDALVKTHPEKRKFCILEDNDPTGYKSNAAKRAKQDLKIVPIAFPTYSPLLLKSMRLRCAG